MEENKYLKDLSEIKDLMNRSTRFLSLSGLSGVLAGCYALVAAWFAARIIYPDGQLGGRLESIVLTGEQLRLLVWLGLTTMVTALVTGLLFSMSKARKNDEPFWNQATKRLLINFLIPLIAGGIVCLILIKHQLAVLVAPMTLIFYGLACVHASKYTIGGVRYLGLTILGAGLLSTWFLGYGLYFWAFGFGICHILYGSLMYFTDERGR